MQKDQEKQKQAFFDKLENTYNRDQLSKFLMYSSKIVQCYFVKRGNYEWSDRFHLFSNKMDDSRKLFRLMKSINEIQKIKKTYYDLKNKDKVNKFIDICIYRCYLSYWLFDNLAILVKYFILNQNNQDQPYYNGLAQKFKLMAVMLNLIQSLRNLLILQYKEVLQKEIKIEDEEQYQKISSNLDCLKWQKQKMYMNIVKCGMDAVLSITRIESVYYQLALEVNDNYLDLLQGIAGSISSCLSTYHSIQAKNINFSTQ